jgi:DNA-binding MarR family transcriptional regulator
MRLSPHPKRVSPHSPQTRLVLEDLAKHDGATAAEIAARLVTHSYQGVSDSLRLLRDHDLVTRDPGIVTQAKGWRSRTHHVTPSGLEMLASPREPVIRKADCRTVFSQSVILEALRTHGPMSRTPLANVTGYSPSNVRVQVERLVDAGWVVNISSTFTRVYRAVAGV